jgi:hypothetical protein
MPTVDIHAEKRRINRALALSRRRGDFITCDAPLSRLSHTAAELAEEAARKAEDLRRWRQSIGPW